MWFCKFLLFYSIINSFNSLIDKIVDSKSTDWKLKSFLKHLLNIFYFNVY